MALVIDQASLARDTTPQTRGNGRGYPGRGRHSPGRGTSNVRGTRVAEILLMHLRQEADISMLFLEGPRLRRQISLL